MNSSDEERINDAVTRVLDQCRQTDHNAVFLWVELLESLQCPNRIVDLYKNLRADRDLLVAFANRILEYRKPAQPVARYNPRAQAYWILLGHCMLDRYGALQSLVSGDRYDDVLDAWVRYRMCLPTRFLTRDFEDERFVIEISGDMEWFLIQAMARVQPRIHQSLDVILKARVTDSFEATQKRFSSQDPVNVLMAGLAIPYLKENGRLTEEIASRLGNFEIR